jgi:hypothetical protein
MNAKTIIKYLPGMILFCLIILGSIRTTGGMPLNLPVEICITSKEFYPPNYPKLCADDPELKKRIFGPGMQSIIFPVEKAFKLGYKPAQKPLKEGYFSEYEVSLLTEMLDHLGIWRVHPWNPDGTWRK